MSRTNTGSTSNVFRLTDDSSIITGYPFTIMAWVKPTTFGSIMALVHYHNVPASDDHVVLRASVNNGYSQYSWNQSNTGTHTGTEAGTLNAWNMYICGAASDGSPMVYIGQDGVNGTQQTDTPTYTWQTNNSAADLTIGGYQNNSGPLNGNIAHVAIWDGTLLSESDCDTLYSTGSGYDPRNLGTSPDFYWPMQDGTDGNETDVVSSKVVTEIGTMGTDGSDNPFTVTVGTSIPVFMNHYRRMRG